MAKQIPTDINSACTRIHTKMETSNFKDYSSTPDLKPGYIEFTSAFVNAAAQLLLTRRGKTRMDAVGRVFEFYIAPL